MKTTHILLAASLSISNLFASPNQGFPWPPAWQGWQTRVCDPGGKELPTTGLAAMKNGELAVALEHGVAVLSSDGKVLRQADLNLGETQGIACAGDNLVLGSGDTLVVVDGKTLAVKSKIPVGGANLPDIQQ